MPTAVCLGMRQSSGPRTARLRFTGGRATSGTRRSILGTHAAGIQPESGLPTGRITLSAAATLPRPLPEREGGYPRRPGDPVSAGRGARREEEQSLRGGHAPPPFLRDSAESATISACPSSSCRRRPPARPPPRRLRPASAALRPVDAFEHGSPRRVRPFTTDASPPAGAGNDLASVRPGLSLSLPAGAGNPRAGLVAASRNCRARGGQPKLSSP